MSRPLVYFVCTGNSARSQMAEGFARHLAGERLEVLSGGIAPAGLHPFAVAVMREVGIDISAQTSRGIDEERLSGAAVVVTLCGDAEERCPITPPKVRRLHWPLPDPAKARGTDEEVTALFRAVRDDIERRVQALVDDVGGQEES